MNLDRPKNVSFLDFVGGVQLLRGDDVRTALPVILIGICVSGAVGNVLVLLILVRDLRSARRGSEVKALLASVATADLLLLLLCAPVRAVTYARQTWTLGGFVCGAADWFQHSCVVAKTFILAVTCRAKHDPVSSTAKGGLPSCPRWIHCALAFIWILSMALPIPQLLFASLQQWGRDTVCVSEIPACASAFMALFYKIYPTATFALPVTFALAYHTKTLHAAVNHHHDAAPGPPQQQQQQQSKVTLVLLCVTGANALMLLPEWGTFTWIRLGYDNKPPVGLVIFAQVLLYACSALSPVILMTMYDDVRRGAIGLWFDATCRGSSKVPKCPHEAEGDGGAEEEVGANNAVVSSDSNANNSQEEAEKKFPDVEHFWTGRRNTHVEEEQDPVPWEREEKML